MSPTRLAAAAGASALLAAWLTAASATRSTTEPLLERPRPAVQPDPLVREAQANLEQVRQRWTAAVGPLEPTRNPFRMGRTLPPDPSVSTPEPQHAVDPGATMPQVSEPPAVSLAGIAEARTADGVQRTAVLSAFGRVILAQEGTDVGGRFRVTSIEPRAVELEDFQTGEMRRLLLP